MDHTDVNNEVLLEAIQKEFKFAKGGTIISPSTNRVIHIPSAEELQALDNFTIHVTRFKD